MPTPPLLPVRCPRRPHHRVAPALACTLALAAPLAQASVVSDWNAAALVEVRATRLGPPVVARALAIVHTCMYDAWAAYDSTAVGTVLDPGLRRPASEHVDANKSVAISHAAYQCLLNLFPGGAQRLAGAMQQRGLNPANTSTDPATPVGIGNLAAQAVLQDRANDGANQYGLLRPGAYADYTYYSPVNPPLPYCEPQSPSCASAVFANARRWQPLVSNSGSTQAFIAPHWGNVRPFGITRASLFDRFITGSASAGSGFNKWSVSYSMSAPVPQVVLGDEVNFNANVEALIGFSRALDADKKLIVEYWADGPESELPPGHWGLFAQAVSARDSHSLDADVKMFFVMHNASMDAGIVAWYLKRKYDGVRPITAVRYAKRGQTIVAWGGPGRPIESIPGERWTPYNPGSNLTPAFPGFISGHTTFSWASATVLQLYKRSDVFNYSTVVPANFGRVEPGVPAQPTTVSFPTFSNAAEMAGLSRLYGGIHFAEDNDLGRGVGIIVGARAWNRAASLFAGYR